MSYKASKEAFVSGTTGSSILHINLISVVALSSISLHSALRSRLPTSNSIPFLAEWFILVLPLILSLTTFANAPVWLSVILLVPTAILLLLPPRDTGVYLPSASLKQQSQMNKSIFWSQLPAVTTYRAHMLLMTVICILAVDFPVFPRSLAKCETWGASIMDLGVGSFVYSQGLVSAIPLTRDPNYLSEPLFPKLAKTTRKSLPIIFLGLTRLLLVKGTQYPEHESEYGTHWNFFITLAFMPALQVLLHPLIASMSISFLGILVATAHQIALLMLGWQRFALDAPRTDIISANKEGLVSLLGYFSIHLLGLSAGTLILPPSPSYFRRQQRILRRQRHGRERGDSESSSESSGPESTDAPPIPTRKPTYKALQRENDKTATELISYSVVWWAMLGLANLTDVGGGISRRVANLQYILWVAAYNVTFLFCYLVLDLYFFPSPLSRSFYSPISKLKTTPPENFTGTVRELTSSPLLEAINKNGLAVFLLANVMTGLVNLSIPTMYTSDTWAMVILIGYVSGVCAVAWAFKSRRIWR